MSELPGCMIGPSDPCAAFQDLVQTCERQAERIAELEQVVQNRIDSQIADRAAFNERLATLEAALQQIIDTNQNRNLGPISAYVML